jgi:hypothetical protein
MKFSVKEDLKVVESTAKNMAKHNELDTESKIEYMTPEKYTEITFHEKGYSDVSIENLKDRVLRGELIETPVLYYGIDGKLSGHDGRHRAIVAKYFKNKKIPVIVTYLKIGVKKQ